MGTPFPLQVVVLTSLALLAAACTPASAPAPTSPPTKAAEPPKPALTKAEGAAPAAAPPAQPAPAAAPASAAQAGLFQHADTIFHNGQVLTVDKEMAPEAVLAQQGKPPFTVAQGVAVKGSAIVAVGSNDSVLALRGPNTKVVDLKGRSLVPGFVDTHAHVVEYSQDTFAKEIPAEYNLPSVRGFDRSKAEGLAELAQHVAKAKPGEPVVVTGRYTAVPLVRETRIEELDRLAPNNPVFIQLSPGTFAGYVNSAALKLVTDAYPGSFGVGYEKDGEHFFDFANKVTKPSGFIVTPLRQAADFLLVKEMPEEQYASFLKREYDEWMKLGITTYSSKQTGWEQRVINVLDTRGELPLRVAYSHEGLGRGIMGLEFLHNMGRMEGHGTDMMWNIGVNLEATDPGSDRGVCLSVHLEDRPGILNTDPWTSKARPFGNCKLEEEGYHARIVERTAQLGMRIAGVHSAGDRATSNLLDLYEAAAKVYPGGIDEFRKQQYAIDHAVVVSPDLIPRARALGVNWSVGPKYIDERDYDSLVKSAGEEFASNRLVPMRSMVSGGVKVSIENDVARREVALDGKKYWNDSPTFRTWQLMTRKTEKGKVIGAHEAIDRVTVLYAWTRWGAEYVLRQDRLGTIETSKLADLVVLSGDYLAVKDEEVKDLSPVLVMVGGKVTHQTAEL
jgi:hypothetical protein